MAATTEYNDGRKTTEIFQDFVKTSEILGKRFTRPDVKAVRLFKVGRNDLCPCGSNKKFKHCCWDKEGIVNSN